MDVSRNRQSPDFAPQPPLVYDNMGTLITDHWANMGAMGGAMYGNTGMPGGPSGPTHGL